MHPRVGLAKYLQIRFELGEEVSREKVCGVSGNV